MSNAEPMLLNGIEVVGYGYFAKALNVGLRTLYAYASETNAQRLANFPRPVTPADYRTPLFAKTDADRFIEERLAGSSSGKGRVKALPLTREQQDAASEAGKILGHGIDLHDREAVRSAIYDELKLPVSATTKETQLPSVNTATVKRLFKQTQHPFLRELLVYRGVNV